MLHVLYKPYSLVYNLIYRLYFTQLRNYKVPNFVYLFIKYFRNCTHNQFKWNRCFTIRVYKYINDDDDGRTRYPKRSNICIRYNIYICCYNKNDKILNEWIWFSMFIFYVNTSIACEYYFTSYQYVYWIKSFKIW